MKKFTLINRKRGPLHLNCIPSIKLAMNGKAQITEEQFKHPDITWAINTGKAKVVEIYIPPPPRPEVVAVKTAPTMVKKNTPSVVAAFTEPERVRNSDGTFVSDDPATPKINEAWVDGVGPKKIIKKKKKKKS